MVSAIKVGGRRLHELAREGEEVERAPRPVRIDRSTSRSSSRAPIPRRRSVVECSQRHVHPHRSRPTSAPRSAAARTSATLRRLRVGSFALDERAPARRRSTPIARRTVLAAARRRCATSSRSSSTASRRGAIAHGVTFAAPTLLGRPTRAPGPFAVVDDRRRRCSRSTNDAARGVKPAVVLAAAGRRRERSGAIRSEVGRSPRRRTAARRHDRRVRRRAPRAPGGAAARARARRRARPRRATCSPSTGIRPRWCGPSRRRSCSRRSSRSSSCSTRPAPSTSASCSRSTRRAARSRRRSSSREVLVERARRRGSWSSAPTSTSATGATATSPLLAAHGRRARLRGARPRSASPDRAAPTTACRTRRPAIRELLARGDVAGAAAILGRPARGARHASSTATRAGASSASRPPTSRCPSAVCLPADGVYAGTFIGADGVERPAAISLGRRPDVLRRRRDAAARGVPARLRRRPLRPERPRCGSAERLRGQERFDSVEASSPRCDRDVEASSPDRGPGRRRALAG